jgi:hypothetical protein
MFRCRRVDRNTTGTHGNYYRFIHDRGGCHRETPRQLSSEIALEGYVAATVDHFHSGATSRVV